mmetsp:Transcript_46466/g.108226  ORF Transcript_46466/g.108226 Transcript_46466/m.108226 type:complete len:383 (+) Transcript_46466:1860-3008(+)
MKEPRRGVEDLSAITDCTPEDPTQHIPTILVGRRRPVSQCNGQCSDVIRNHAVGHVYMVSVFIANLASVLPSTRLLLDLGKDILEQVCVIVASYIKEDGRHTLEAHASIHAWGWQVRQAAIILTVELHEHVVPNFQHIWIIHVHKMGCITPANAVVVDLCTRATGPCVTHLPEVVLHIEWQNVTVWQVLSPQVASFFIGRHAWRFRISTVVCCIEAVGVQLVDLGQEFPGPSDRFLLEVVSKGPVAQHFKEGVVVHILANVLKVIVLTTSAYALLRVCRTLELVKRVVWFYLPNEDLFELIHARVDKEQRRIIERYNWRGGDEVMATFLLEELDEGVSNLFSGRELPTARAKACAGDGLRRRRGRRRIALCLRGHKSAGEGS